MNTQEVTNPVIFRTDNEPMKAPATAPPYPALVPLDNLWPSPDNPRTLPEDLSEMKDSIRANRLIQALSARPHPENEGHFLIFEGCLRLESLMQLRSEGEIPEDYQVAILVHPHHDASNDKKLGIIANTFRRPLHPLDEARAWDDILQTGVDVKDLALQAGISLTTIRRRLALNGLTQGAKETFYRGEIGLGQAQALSLGSPDQQEDIIGNLGRYGHVSTDGILSAILRDRPNKAAAAFDIDLYDGTFTTNLFSDDDQTYFDDVDQFFRLQHEHIAKLKTEYKEKGASFVVVAENWWNDQYRYRVSKAKSPKDKGIAIIIKSDGRLDIRENLVPNGYSSATNQALDEDGKRQKPPRPAYGSGLREDMNRHRALAVCRRLLENPRKAKEIAVFQMLSGHEGCRRVTPHEALRVTAQLSVAKDGDKRTVPDNYNTIHAVIEDVAKKLFDDQRRSNTPVAIAFMQHHWYQQERTLYDRIVALSDEELDVLHLYLPVVAFGPPYPQEINTGDGVFNAVARDLDVVMRDHWTPDRYFFSQRTVDQLKAIATETGLVQENQALPDKKKDLVDALTTHFAEIQPGTHGWMPGPMHFPAYDDFKDQAA